MFYFCPVLDLSVAFTSALYIVGLGWLSIVITLQAGLYRVRFPAWARGFSLLQNVQTGKVKNEWSYTSASSVCLHGIDSENFTLTFCLSVLYVAVNVSYFVQTFDYFMTVALQKYASETSVPFRSSLKPSVKKDMTGHVQPLKCRW
jgi:hypothetical protein